MNKLHIGLAAVLIAVFAVFFAVPAQADNTYGMFTYTVSEKATVTITGYTGEGGDIVIPSQIDSKPVTEFDGNAFRGNSTITGIEIPEGVRLIYTRSFAGCTNLKSVTLPESVTGIGDYAFLNCSSLTEITLPKGVGGYMVGVFAGCTNLQTINVAEGNTDLCVKDGILYRKDMSCLFCYPAGKEVESVTIPSGVERIYPDAFTGSKITSVTIPDSVTIIHEGAFYGCEGLTRLFIPGSVKQIGKQAFYGCRELKEVIIANGTTSIGAEAFAYCRRLVWASVPPSVTSIGKNAFYYYDNDLVMEVATGSEALTYAEENNIKYTIADFFIKPQIVTQPSSTTVAFGETVTLSVETKGGGLQYQWLFKLSGNKWLEIPESKGGTSPVYSFEITMLLGSYVGGGEYCCKVSNSNGTVYSDTVTVTVDQRPGITKQPSDAEVKEGETASFSITAVGKNRSYQWYYRLSEFENWTAVPEDSGKTADYSFTAKQEQNGYQFYCKVENSAGSIDSTVVELTVKTEAPVSVKLPFVDVKESASYYDAVYWAYTNGVVKGTDKKHFSPKDTCTRGQFCVMLYKMNGSPSISGMKNPFKDVKAGKGAGTAIIWCANQKIIAGYTLKDGTREFRSGKTITRGDMLLMLWKMAGKPGTTLSQNPFTDVPNGTSRLTAYKWAYEQKITTAKTLKPNDPTLRYMLTQFLYKYNNIYHIK